MKPSISPRSSSERLGPGCRGFTLLEILVAVSIVALVLLAVYGVFASVSRARERLEAEGEVYQRARVIFDRLGRELRGVSPVGGPREQGVLRAGQDGGGNPFLELTTSATAQLGAGQTGIALVRYALVADRDPAAGKVLLRSERSALAAVDAGRDAGAMRLAAGIARLEWRFLVQGEWRSELDADRDGLPALAELHVTMLSADARATTFRSAFELPDIAWSKP